ncbi:hypothetical protein LCGC14_1429520 [marine sediment metagenome]|uniref:Uncharacterized protein n=1 Tax=marine sediment metagenome TaxID=412755 RepID=A0A0F9JP04_9ZZZZ
MNRRIARNVMADIIRGWRRNQYIPLEVKCSSLPRYKAYRVAAIYKIRLGWG